ncbi:hypothetical protein Ahia01_001364400 [Argonauta hians]
MDNEDDSDIIRCFQHCTLTTNIFYTSHFPVVCPLCGEDVAHSDPIIPPYRINCPFTDAAHNPFSVVVKPTLGTFLKEYQKESNLHIGVTNSQGVVYEYDENGTSIGSPSWAQCVAVSFGEALPGTTLWSEWDSMLDQYSRNSQWTSQRYDEDGHNCFSFVLGFLKVTQLLPSAASKQDFTDHFLLRRMVKCSKYIYMHRQIAAQGCTCLPAPQDT